MWEGTGEMAAVLNGSDLELDRDLVERHQAGDDAAFTQLYALHYGRLVRFCLRLTRDHHTAEEIAQEAFARAFATLDRFGGERRFYPWLTVIARRLVIDHARRNERVETRAHVDAGFASPAEDVVVQRLDGRHLTFAMDRLTVRHQDVIRLRDAEGLSYEAIAERLGVPVTTIPPLLHRARATLRREYVRADRGRAASWLHLSPVIAAARRLRDRLAVWGSHLPDASMFAAPMAGAVLGATALLAPQVMMGEQGDVRFGASTFGLHVPERPGAGQAEAAGSATQPAEHAGQDHPAGNSKDFVNPSYALRDAGVRPEETVLRYVMDSDPATSDERQDEVRRMPIYYEEEYTGIYLGVNPEAAVHCVQSSWSCTETTRERAGSALGH
ncbi:MAG TPA: RNA polymerase sigma factor [Egibacteraceae bacterium]|nr:RNA polymerase sigma factor [Egibacteraceae bacterium]